MLKSDNFKKKVVIGGNFNILRIFRLIKIVRIARLKSLVYSIEDKMTKKKSIVLIKLMKFCIYMSLVAYYIVWS